MHMYCVGENNSPYILLSLSGGRSHRLCSQCVDDSYSFLWQPFSCRIPTRANDFYHPHFRRVTCPHAIHVNCVRKPVYSATYSHRLCSQFVDDGCSFSGSSMSLLLPNTNTKIQGHYYILTCAAYLAPHAIHVSCVRKPAYSAT
jgi:hypothetical protein